jgi:hypothetical protein
MRQGSAETVIIGSLRRTNIVESCGLNNPRLLSLETLLHSSRNRDSGQNNFSLAVAYLALDILHQYALLDT